MDIVFMGTPDFALPTLDAIYDSDNTLLAVVTQPDRPRGRGQKLTHSPVKRWAVSKGVPVLQPRKARDASFIEELKGLSPDLIVTAAYGQILPKSILDIPPKGCINVHASLLPSYRGAAPIHQAILDGCERTGVTIMYMDEAMDTGDILLQKAMDIREDMTCEDLHDALAALGGECISEILPAFEEGKPEGTPQVHDEATYCGKITKDMGMIDWREDADCIRRRVCALTPWPGTYTMVEGQRLKILAAEIVEDGPRNARPGDVYIFDEKDGVRVKCGQGALRLKEIQAPGKRPMADTEFIKGYRMRIARFELPQGE